MSIVFHSNELILYAILVESVLLEQANEWIKNTEHANGLVVVQCTDENYIDVIANAISAGSTVLLENFRKILRISSIIFQFSLDSSFPGPLSRSSYY